VHDAAQNELNPYASSGQTMTFRWEVRRSLRWGSRHEGWFSSEKDAIQYVENLTKLGGTYNRVDNVFYFSQYPDDA